MYVVGGGMLVVGLVLGGLLSSCMAKNKWHMMDKNPGMYHEGSMHGDMRKNDSMKGVMEGMMHTMDGKTGAELEKAFLEEMIVHHEGAVSMAEALIAGTTRPELLTLGREIITAQMKEIEQMKGWLNEWFLAAPTTE